MAEMYEIEIQRKNGIGFKIVAPASTTADAMQNARRQYPRPDYIVMSARKTN